MLPFHPNGVTKASPKQNKRGESKQKQNILPSLKVVFYALDVLVTVKQCDFFQQKEKQPKT